MIRTIGENFWKERGYILLFLILIATYGYFGLVARTHPHSPQQSTEVRQFRQAERKVQQDIRDSGSLTKFLENKPLLQRILSILSFLVAGAFSIGIIINLFLIFNPAWRRSLTNHSPPPIHADWKMIMFIKVVLLWIAASLSLNLLFLALRSFFFPQMTINLYLLLHTTISDLLCIVFILFIIRQYGGSPRDLGLWVPKGRLGHEIAVGLGGYLAILPIFFSILIFLAYIAQLMSYEPPAHPLVNVFVEEEQRSPFLICYSIFLACVIAPIFEEIFFRGFVYRIFREKWGVFWGMVVSAGLFALIHQNTFAFWPIFVLGMGMAYLYEKRQNLVPSIVLHIVHNSVFIAYFFIIKEVIAYAGRF